MKEIAYVFLIVLFFVSCDKEKDTEKNSTNIKELQGFWRWTSSTGGIAGSTHTPESTNVSKFIYIGDHVISFYKDGAQKRAETFEIQSNTSIYNHQNTPMFVFEGYQQSFETEGNVLLLKDELYDGFVHSYKRDNLACTEIFYTLTIMIKDEKENPIALDKMEVVRLDTNTNITDKLLGSEWEIFQKRGSYPIYNDLFVQEDEGKSLTINFKGFINNKLVIDVNNVVGADSCHIFYVSGNREITISQK